MLTDLERSVVSGSGGYLAVYEHFLVEGKNQNPRFTGVAAFAKTEQLFESVTGRVRFEKSGYEGFKVMRHRYVSRILKCKR